MGSKLIAKGDDCFDGLDGVGGGVVSGGGVVFQMVSSSDGEKCRCGKCVLGGNSMGMDSGATLYLHGGENDFWGEELFDMVGFTKQHGRILILAVFL
nr:hypothetical protein [Tanacetum cinerariifolium]